MTQEEFKYCFDSWFEGLRNYIAFRCMDADLATDIVQEAFMKVWEKDLEYRGKATKSLLYKIASDLWVSQHRKKGSEQQYKSSFFQLSTQSNADEQLHYEELKQQYEKALSKLPENQRSVFLMSRMDFLSYSEIATRLSVSTKAIEKRMTAALKFLRNELSYGKAKP